VSENISLKEIKFHKNNLKGVIFLWIFWIERVFRG